MWEQRVVGLRARTPMTLAAAAVAATATAVYRAIPLYAFSIHVLCTNVISKDGIAIARKKNQQQQQPNNVCIGAGCVVNF